MMNSKSFLALGDSYTIGEAVKPEERWSHQFCDMLRNKGVDLLYPRIIATTGWTTSELQHAIDEANIDETYDLVSLSIGVNNQYRAESIDQYANEFRSLLTQAVSFAGNIKQHVLVVSIPDWGATPFAEGRDRAQIAKEIDQFNSIKKAITHELGVTFIDITEVSKLAANNKLLNASDGLHPSGLMYSKWADLIYKQFSGF